MSSRTCSNVTTCVAEQLKIFTPAELFYVLQEDAKLSFFDVHRIKKITDATRYRFGSAHSYEQVMTVIKSLGDAFKQGLPVQNGMSLSFILYRQNQDPVISPFSSVCDVCQQSLNEFDTKQRSIKIYCVNGTVISGKIMCFVCNHVNSKVHRNLSKVTIYPNFIHHNDNYSYTHLSLHHGEYVYVGGNVAVEKALIDRFTAEFIHEGLSIHGFVNSLNQQAYNNKHPQLSQIDPHIISNIVYRYLFIQLYISMGNVIVSTPCQSTDYDLWAWKEFPRVLSCFTYLWMNHQVIIGSCNESCSKCLVVDGHQKSRRRICAFKDVRINTEEMNQITIGCCRTPISSSKYCDLHNGFEAEPVIGLEVTNSSVKKSLKRLKRSAKGRYIDKLFVTSCQTGKERSDAYVKKCSRSFGLIALIFNCKIIAGFSELFRSETLKEIINLFCSCIRVSGRLAPTLVYDDGCHLVAYVRNHIGFDLARSDALQLLASTPVSVHRMHFKNHVGKFCRLEMNPNNNRLLDDVNTEAAEQCFSWLKKYSSIISNMNWLRAPIFLIILFHYKNLSYVHRRPSDIFHVYDRVLIVTNVSLCHSADSNIEHNKIYTDMTLNKNINNGLISEPLNLPASRTDWEYKVRQLNIKSLVL